MTDTVFNQYASIRDTSSIISIKASLIAEVYLEEETGLYVSYCPALDLCSQGKTPKEAEKNITEAAELFIEDCLERGVLNEILEECGFHSIHQDHPPRKTRKKTPPVPGSRQISIPAELPMMAYG